MSDLTHNASLIGAGSTITGGVLAWLGNNASAIGVLITIGTFILTATFMILNYKLNKQRLEFDRRKMGSCKDCSGK